MEIVLIILLIVIILFPAVRTIVCHPLSVLYYAIKDTYKYIRYRRWNECKPGVHYGVLNMYVGSNNRIFGSGKTLTAVEWVISVYDTYNGKKVFNQHTKKWEIQEIRIVSNVELNIPYVPLKSTDDIINCHEGLNESSVSIVFIDEAGTQFNSRNFKTNISSTLLNSMLTCRHQHFGMILTSPRYLMVDSLMRNICSIVSECRKIWRLQMLYKCSAWDLENCTNVMLVPHWTSCWFVKDKHYNAYDTYANVDEIKRMQKNGELLSDSEVLELQGNGTNTDLYRLSKRTHKVKKLNK